MQVNFCGIEQHTYGRINLNARNKSCLVEALMGGKDLIFGINRSTKSRAMSSREKSHGVAKIYASN